MVLKITCKFIDKLEEIFIVLCLAFMAGMNFANVVSRYCFANSFSFTEELTIMAFVWISMFGISAGYKRYSHLGMSYVVEKFPKKGQAYFALFSMVCSFVMIVVMVYYGVLMVQGQIALHATTPALKLPQAMQGLSIPVGGAFIALRTLQSGVLQYRRLSAEARELKASGTAKKSKELKGSNAAEEVKELKGLKAAEEGKERKASKAVRDVGEPAAAEESKKPKDSKAAVKDAENAKDTDGTKGGKA